MPERCQNCFFLGDGTGMGNCCKNCVWWDEPNSVCCNADSENVADFTMPDDRCEEYEANENRGS